MAEEFDLSDCSNRKVILLVEDEDADMYLLKKAIHNFWSDCDIIAVKSLHEAYQKYREKNFDLVLLDLNLPDGFGPSTVQEIRRFNKSMPIVVVTGMGTTVTVDESLKMGANNVVLKSQLNHPDFKNILKQNV